MRSTPFTKRDLPMSIHTSGGPQHEYFSHQSAHLDQTRQSSAALIWSNRTSKIAKAVIYATRKHSTTSETVPSPPPATVSPSQSPSQPLPIAAVPYPATVSKWSERYSQSRATFFLTRIKECPNKPFLPSPDDNIFSAILKSFTNIGRSSPEVATNLLDAGLGDTVYGLLVGQTPPEIPDEHDLALELTSNSQIQQAIGLVVEVLPPLPKSGIFDPRLAKKPINP
ncbi:Ubiquitin fusion degradation protein 4 [Puccinia graminis f. sp. tritici]|uniref:Ubiquitin fusion degradation protein 4 n=1 Tax=Puccinia graminis f. sp. tritici TaxID=56615 RepID=A0A5B0N1Q7_PUCGR|nr:Ubiquitin fusion degradation protein 4 [Puccinia graminis f. sp. tritici]